MPTVIADATESAQLSYDASGYQITRTFHVSGVTGTASTRLYNAVTATGVPRRGDAHPDIPGIQVLRVFAELRMSSAGEVAVRVEYGELPSGETADEKTADAGTVLDKRLGARLGPKRAINKNDGNPIVDSNGARRDVLLEQSELTFSFSRVVASLAAARADGQTFLNSVNAAAWSGDAARTWRVLSLDATPIQGRADNAVREDWELVYSPETWDYDATWLFNGLPISATARVYAERDFSLLGVTI